MTVGPAKSNLLAITAAAALFAAPALAQSQTQQRDGAPGNPPSTAAQRAADGATGNRTPSDGTAGNPPGTALGRAADSATDAVGRAADVGPSDSGQGNPPGTVVTRGVDRALGSNISGAFPENEGNRNGSPQNDPQGSAGARPGIVADPNRAAQGGDRGNQPPAANANPRIMGSTQAQGAQSGGQGSR